MNWIWLCKAGNNISPTLEAHEKTHPVKQAAVFSQKVNPAAAQMIAELVADGITEIDDMK